MPHVGSNNSKMQAFIDQRKPHVNSKRSPPTLSEMGTPAEAEESNRGPKILLPRLPLPPPPGLRLMTVCIPRRITGGDERRRDGGALGEALFAIGGREEKGERKGHETEMR
ncbi:hypothetical protein BHE74_00042566 [Ensete ventricosum]|nr:hypothetical protein BHE74_00042566 [Ensete ventricosum]